MAVQISERITQFALAGAAEGGFLSIPGLIISGVTNNPVIEAGTVSSILVAGVGGFILLLDERLRNRENQNNS